MFLGFAIKVPMFPFHTWLPDAHTEAPTVGSVLLAAIMLKLGTYGFIRIALPMLPSAAQSWAPWIGLLAVIGIIYGALCCLAQRDMKRGAELNGFGQALRGCLKVAGPLCFIRGSESLVDRLRAHAAPFVR